MLMIQVFPKARNAIRQVSHKSRLKEVVLEIRDMLGGTDAKFRIFVGDRLASSILDRATPAEDIRDGAIVTFIEDDPSNEHAW